MNTITVQIPRSLEASRATSVLQSLFGGARAQQALDILEDIILGQEMTQAEDDELATIDQVKKILGK